MTTLRVMPPPHALVHYGAALHRTVAGQQAALHLHDAAGVRPARQLALARWCGVPHAGDAGLLARCTGPTLDVGCGPGRLTAELARTGLPALGIDISPDAVRLALQRGAPARRADIFRVRDDGAWRHVLLADGNIGIGGNPYRLLRCCARLLTPGGDILLELDPPGSGSWTGRAALHYDGRTSRAFPWAVVAADDLAALAGRAGMAVLESWTDAHRWFARVGLS